MTHIGQKFALGAIGFLRHFHGFALRHLRLLALGNVRKQALGVPDTVFLVGSHGAIVHPDPFPILALDPALHVIPLSGTEERRKGCFQSWLVFCVDGLEKEAGAGLVGFLSSKPA